jgi:hypothetical protein
MKARPQPPGYSELADSYRFFLKRYAGESDKEFVTRCIRKEFRVNRYRRMVENIARRRFNQRRK